MCNSDIGLVFYQECGQQSAPEEKKPDTPLMDAQENRDEKLYQLMMLKQKEAEYHSQRYVPFFHGRKNNTSARHPAGEKICRLVLLIS